MTLPFDWFRWIFNYEPIKEEPIKQCNMKVAVIVGHHLKDGGAFSPTLGMNEFNFYHLVTAKLRNVTVFFHDHKISGYTSRIKDTAKRVDAGNFDLVIECHFNAAIPEANGCETLFYFKSIKGKQYAQEFSNLVNQRTGIKLRNGGLKPLVNEKDRGFASVFYPSAPTILIEPFFGSNVSDCEKIGGVDNMASIIQEFIDNLFN